MMKNMKNMMNSRTFASAVPQEQQQSNNNNSKTKNKIKKRTFDTSERDPIIVTDRAASRIEDLLRNYEENHPGEPNPTGIRLGVRRRGCNGLSYTLNYVYDTERDNKTVSKDVRMDCSKFHLYIEPMALFNIVGTTMDWEETELSSEFTFSNPNSKGVRNRASFPVRPLSSSVVFSFHFFSPHALTQCFYF